MPAARFLVSGRVQGVCFRAGAREQALGLGVAGCAKNLPDGRVEVVASGTAEALDALGRWLRQGPPHATVTAVDRTALPDQPLRGFHIA
ncbi:acylphosphatase [Rhodanobacter geophilus]|uniref:acylphosphatase n=1 Tax=Rhodanobacter geophilus TaxID=3162488 RepID=A0ABV3QQS9_9GAMM